MPRRCGCASGSCSCVVEGGNGVQVTGSGSVSDPYRINADEVPLTGKLQVQDTDTVDLSLTGQGTTADPYVLTATVDMSLGELTDVDDTDTTAGYVLARLPDGTFGLVPPSTAPVGEINTDASIDGDGSAGDPLRVHDYEYIPFMEGASNLPNLGDLYLGDADDTTSTQFGIQRAGQAGQPMATSRVRNWLYPMGGDGNAAHWQLDFDGAPVSAFRLLPGGRLATSANGADFYPLPFRQYALFVNVPTNGTDDAEITVPLPPGMFTTTPRATTGIASRSNAYHGASVGHQATPTQLTVRVARAGQPFTVNTPVDVHLIQMEP